MRQIYSLSSTDICSHDFNERMSESNSIMPTTFGKANHDPCEFSIRMLFVIFSLRQLDNFFVKCFYFDWRMLIGVLSGPHEFSDFDPNQA